MRHRWQERLRTAEETHRVCVRCGLARITVRSSAPAHIPGIRDRAGNLVATEFWRDGFRLPAATACADGVGTPAEAGAHGRPRRTGPAEMGGPVKPGHDGVGGAPRGQETASGGSDRRRVQS